MDASPKTIRWLILDLVIVDNDVKNGVGGSFIEEPKDDSTWSRVDRRRFTIWLYLLVIGFACFVLVIWYPTIRWYDLIYLILLFILGFSGLFFYQRFKDGEEKTFLIHNISKVSTKANVDDLIEVITVKLSITPIHLFSIFFLSLGYRQYRDNGRGRLLINIENGRQYIPVILSPEALKYKDELDELIRKINT